MTEYIKREAAIDDVLDVFYDTTDIDLSGEKLEAAILNIQTADVEPVQRWIPVDERLPENFISVLGYMTDAEEFPPVRECYTVGNAFFFPALGDVHPVSHWREMPEPPKGE